MRPPRIYTAILAVSRGLSKVGLPKGRVNEVDGYAFRGIDEVMEAVAPLLHRHRICVLPRLTDRSERFGPFGTLVSIKGSFEFVSAADASKHTVETFGEAIDRSEKASSKAMSAAYKYALIQTFCIPVKGLSDADSASPELAAFPDPVQGWASWAKDIVLMIEGCVSVEAVAHVQRTYERELRALADAKRPEFNEIGRSIRAQMASLGPPADRSTHFADGLPCAS